MKRSLNHEDTQCTLPTPTWQVQEEDTTWVEFDLQPDVDDQSSSGCTWRGQQYMVQLAEGTITNMSTGLMQAIRRRPDDDSGQQQQPASKRVPAAAKASDKVLTGEQQHVLDAAVQGRSLFLTGRAGTGKSFLLTAIVEQLKETLGDSKVFCTASTGSAACLVSGVTVHSFAGIGIGNESKEILARKVSSSKTKSKNWKNAAVLVIDEVSMLSARLLDSLEFIARSVRKKPSTAWGGIQVIVSGDFHQIPPVGDRGESDAVDYAFHANTWRETFGNGSSFCLQIPHRQSDSVLLNLLTEVRNGRLSNSTLALLSNLKNTHIDTSDGIEATKLFAKNHEVDGMNESRLVNLAGQLQTFDAVDRVRQGTQYDLKALQKSSPLLTTVKLKVDAQVVLLRNLDQSKGLVNGCRGRVTGFMPEPSRLPIVLWTTASGPVELVMKAEETTSSLADKVLASRRQIPLKLAFALSIHKSQGMSISRLEVHLKECWDFGQAYVALSRCTSLQTLRVASFNQKSFKTNPAVTRFMSQFATGEDAAAAGAGSAADGAALSPGPGSRQLHSVPYPTPTTQPQLPAVSQSFMYSTTATPQPITGMQTSMALTPPTAISGHHLPHHTDDDLIAGCVVLDLDAPAAPVAALGTPLAASTALTPDQLKRANENRARALEKRAQKTRDLAIE